MILLSYRTALSRYILVNSDSYESLVIIISQVGPEGLEPSTLSVSETCSNLLSYRPIKWACFVEEKKL